MREGPKERGREGMYNLVTPRQDPEASTAGIVILERTRRREG